MTVYPQVPIGFFRRLASALSSRYSRVTFSLWGLAVLAICVRVALSPHRQSVYSADYEPAGWHWFHGQEIYSLRHHFIYGPPVAAAFVPLAVLPEWLGNVLWRLTCTAGVLYSAAKWLRSGLSELGSVLPPAAETAASVTLYLLMLPLVAGNINLGQMNLLILVLTTGGVLAVRKHLWSLAALLIAVAGFIKIYPLAIGMLLALLYPKKFAGRLVLAVIIVFIGSLGLQHPSYVWNEYHHWFAVLNGDDRLDTDLFASWRDFGFLLRASGVPLSDHAYRIMEVGAGAMLAVFLWWGQQRWKWTEARLLGGVYGLGCSWMVLFGPATEAATYVLLALPVCAALVAAWTWPVSVGQPPARRGLTVVFVSAYALLVLADLVNAWARDITHYLFVRGLQPVAAILFAAGIVWWLVRRPMLVTETPTE